MNTGFVGPRNSRGITLIELMVAVGILGIIVAIGVPLYQDYVTSARVGVMRDNIQTIRLFEDDYRLQNRAYISGTYDPGDPNDANGLKARLDWSPRTTEDPITYVVTCGAVATAPECTVSGGYYVTATHEDYPNDPICIEFAGASCP